MNHRLICQAKRNGKNRVALELAEQHASAGEHVHLGFDKCWNGGPECLAYVKEQFQWEPK